jgi:hypothetical protein
MNTQLERTTAYNSHRAYKSTIHRSIRHSLLPSTSGLIILVLQILALTSSPLPLFARDGSNISGMHGGSIFQERPPLVWLERSVAECEKTLSSQVGDNDQACQSRCDKQVPARPDERKATSEAVYAKILAVLEPAHAEAVDIAGLSTPQSSGTFRSSKDTESLAAIRSTLANLRNELSESGGLLTTLEMKKTSTAKGDKSVSVGPPPPATQSEQPKEAKDSKELDAIRLQLDRANAQYNEARSEYDRLKAKEEVLQSRLRMLLSQRHLRDEYDKTFPGAGIKTDRPRGYTLAELAIMAGDRQKIDDLLRLEGQSGMASMKQRLIDAIASNNVPLTLELIRIGADLSQNPGAYSALALSSTFGERRISAMLIKNGAWIVTPWTLYEVGPDVHRKALQYQLQRIEEFSREIREPHPATNDKIQRLKCRLQCGIAVKSTAARTGD